MTRNDFIHRAALGIISCDCELDADYVRETVTSLADEVQKQAPFDDVSYELRLAPQRKE